MRHRRVGGAVRTATPNDFRIFVRGSVRTTVGIGSKRLSCCVNTYGANTNTTLSVTVTIVNCGGDYAVTGPNVGTGSRRVTGVVTRKGITFNLSIRRIRRTVPVLVGRLGWGTQL